jgi:hypothetical protein
MHSPVVFERVKVDDPIREIRKAVIDGMCQVGMEPDKRLIDAVVDALPDFFRQLVWTGDPVYRIPSACRDSCKVFHRDIEGRVVAEFVGPNAQAMAEQFCELFGEPSGSKR